jgi:prepilin-type processing-associated H-X9-DG protein
MLWAGGHGLVTLMISRPNFAWGDGHALTTLMVDGRLTSPVGQPPRSRPEARNTPRSASEKACRSSKQTTH